jgi:eukaryotic-like serine/threonine-protein kinase
MAQAQLAHPRPTAAAPEAIGRYRVSGVLGQGGMGIVYRAQDPNHGGEVAIKTVRSPHESDISGLRREISALWRLRHPGVVRILDEGLHRGCPWFAMELLHGTTLRRLNVQLWAEGGGGRHELTATSPPRTRIDESTVSGAMLASASVGPTAQRPRRSGRPPAAGGRLREVLLLMRRLCAALAYVHGSGYVHRDLKPTNVFLRPDGSPVLVDLGLVCRFPGLRAREALEPAGVRVGTVHYMAPEQIRAELVDARADMYALGCLLYETVTGQRVFEARTTEEVAEQQLAVAPTPPGKLVSDLPPALDELILTLLVKDPRERTAHAEDIAEQLARLAPDPESRAGIERSEPRTPYFFRPSPAGRRSVLAEIERAIYTGVHGQGSMILLAGERGAGKTFLLTQAVRQAALHDFRVVTGRCLPADHAEVASADGPGVPLHPLRNLLRVVADRCRKGGPAAVARLLGPRISYLARFEPSLRAFLPRGSRSAALPAGDDQTWDPWLAALAETLAALAAEQRLMIALDDLQWADPLTLAFLETLRPERLGRIPLLVVGAHRADSKRPQLQAVLERSGARAVTLGPLTGDALVALVGDLLAMPCPPGGLVKLMERRSCGNPAQLIEALRGAASDGLLARRHGRWVVSHQLQPAFWLKRTVRLEGDLSPS